MNNLDFFILTLYMNPIFLNTYHTGIFQRQEVLSGKHIIRGVLTGYNRWLWIIISA